MALIGFNGRVIQFSNRLVDFDIPITPMTVVVGGTQFPAINGANFTFDFSFPASITVDYGDGTAPQTYSTVDRGSNSGIYRYRIQWFTRDGTTPDGGAGYPSPYVFQDGKTTHTIKFTINNRYALTNISVGGQNVSNSGFSVNWQQFPALQILALTPNAFNPLDITAIAALPKLSTVNILFVTYVFPQALFLTKVTSLTLTLLVSSSYDKSFSSANLDQLPNLQATLQALSIQNWIQDVDGTNGCPDNWSQLKLTSLTISGQALNANNGYNPRNVTNLFPAFRNMTTIQVLKNTNPVDSYSEYGGLTGLTSIALGTYQLFYCAKYIKSTVLPSFISTSIPNLKSITMPGIYRSSPTPQADIDDLITNVYNYVNTNAAKTGTSAISLRYVVLNLDRSATYTGGIPGNATGASGIVDADITSMPPSGTYQQPTGYVSGANNGSPASPQEMIWLLVNQYKWTVTVPKPIPTNIPQVNASVSVAKTSSTLITITVNTGITNVFGITGSTVSVQLAVDYVINGVTTRVFTQATVAWHASIGTGTLTIPAASGGTAAVTSVNVIIYAIRQNPMGLSTDSMGTLIMYNTTGYLTTF